MKSKLLMLVMMTFSFTSYTFSQIQNERLDITFLKTTSIVFDYPIINVDRGSKDVIAQKVNGAENTLQIKAARRSFPETNLTVITADGRLHHFYLTYTDDPTEQTFWIDTLDMEIKFKEKINVKEFENKAHRIIDQKKSGSCAKDNKYKVKFSLKGIYIDGDEIFYHLSIKNKSNINFDVQSLRFFIRDKQKIKRTASQENELHPVYILNHPVRIFGNSSENAIYALPKFTIPDAKALDIELFEKNGGRNLKLRIENQAIVNAEKLAF